MRTLAIVAGALALCGCHRLLPGSVRCSARGGPEWREYRSKHFVLDTDLDRAAAAALVGDLERIQALVTAGLVGAPREIPGYVRVVAPAREETYRDLDGPFSLGYFTVGVLKEPTIAIHPQVIRQNPEVIAHELAHHLAWYFFPRQPLWFAEGLASFVQTVASDTPPYGRVAGVVPRDFKRLRLASAVRAKDLLRRRMGDAVETTFPLWSWVLYSWLWNERSKQLADFQHRLGMAEDPEKAWIAAFPDLDPESRAAMRGLETSLERHVTHGELTYYRVSAHSVSTFSEAALSPADVHILFLVSSGRGSKGVVNAALADDPLNPVALVLGARLEHRRAADALRRSAAARPGDWRTWALLGGEIGEEGQESDERISSYRRAAELNPDASLALNGLARELAKRGKTAEALPFARRAVDLSPANASNLDTLAKIALDAGACDEAIALQHRAVDVSPRSRKSLREHLATIESQCGRAGAPVTPAETNRP